MIVPDTRSDDYVSDPTEVLANATRVIILLYKQTYQNRTLHTLNSLEVLAVQYILIFLKELEGSVNLEEET